MSIPLIGLDRDGTINIDKGYIKDPADFEPISGSLEAIKLIREKGYDVVILSNQAGIMKKIMTEIDVDRVNYRMLEMLGQIGCPNINGLYYSMTNLKEDIYAKPNIGMFQRAEKEIGVDWKNSHFVGDKISDLKAAVKAKSKPVLVKTGHGEETFTRLNTFSQKDLKKITLIYDNLLAFAETLPVVE